MADTRIKLGIDATDGIYAAGNSGSSLTIDWSRALITTVTMTASCTFAFSGALAGQAQTLILTQGGSGSYTAAWPTMKWSGGTPPTLTTTVGKIDFLTIFYDGSSYYGFVGGQNY
jgi:hypothetical protein